MLESPPPPPDPIVDGCFERGDQVQGIAKSKAKKSWFFLGLGLHVAAGRDFCGYRIPRPRRVVYINLEIKIDWAKRRASTCRTYGIDPDEIGDRFTFVNARGFEEETLKRLAAWPANKNVDLIIVDPLSNLLGDADECNATDMRRVFGLFGSICNRGPAVCLILHDGKGVESKKSALDRGCGSSVMARVFDCRFILTPHQDDPDNMIVCEALQRNFDNAVPKSLVFEKSTRTFRNVDLPAIAAGAPRNAAHTMTKVERGIKSVLDRHPGITTKDLIFKVRVVTGLEERTIHKGLATLTEQGEIEGIPEDPTRNNSVKHWWLCTATIPVPRRAQ